MNKFTLASELLKLAATIVDSQTKLKKLLTKFGKVTETKNTHGSEVFYVAIITDNRVIKNKEKIYKVKSLGLFIPRHYDPQYSGARDISMIMDIEGAKSGFYSFSDNFLEETMSKNEAILTPDISTWKKDLRWLQRTKAQIAKELSTALNTDKSLAALEYIDKNMSKRISFYAPNKTFTYKARDNEDIHTQTIKEIYAIIDINKLKRDVIKNRISRGLGDYFQLIFVAEENGKPYDVQIIKNDTLDWIFQSSLKDLQNKGSLREITNKEVFEEALVKAKEAYAKITEWFDYLKNLF